MLFKDGESSQMENKSVLSDKPQHSEKSIGYSRQLHESKRMEQVLSRNEPSERGEKPKIEEVEAQTI